jgi:3-phenylpropionate/trans-cinnamate dioxygenase ferredoxin component
VNLFTGVPVDDPSCLPLSLIRGPECKCEPRTIALFTTPHGDAAARQWPAGMPARLPLVNPIHAVGLRNERNLPKTETIEVCPASELGPGEMRLVEWEDLEIGVFNCGGTLHAIEDRCSHDNGPLAEGQFDEATCTVECPRHGSLFDIRTGQPKTLPAYQAVDTFPVTVEDEIIKLEVD